MTKAEEKRREKARNLRYRKPIVKDLNIDSIQRQLEEIEEECAEVHWYCDSEDGWDTLLNAMDGDGEEAGEFRYAFAELEASCQQMRCDMRDATCMDERLEEYFDLFFAGIRAGGVGGGLLGYDSYEEDYYGLSSGWESSSAEDEARKKLGRLTKDKLFDLAGSAFRIAVNFLSLRSRYDDLKAALDILKDQNTALLKQVQAIEEIWEQAEAEGFGFYNKSEKALDRLIEALPDRAWIE